MRSLLRLYCPLAVGAIVLAVGCSQPETPPNTETTGTSGSSTTGTTGTTSGAPMTPVNFEADVKPTLANFCAPCHSGPNAPKQLDVTKIATNADAAAHKADFAKMARMVEDKKMPPEKAKKHPTDDERAKLVEQLKSLSS